MNTQIRKKRSLGKLVVLNEEELIRQVAIRPVLYDRSLKAYRKTTLRLQYWNEVSAAMDATMEECRRRWRSLRDSFAKHYKHIQRSSEENVIHKHRKWIFYDQMSFMIPYLDNASYELDDQILDEFGDNSDDGQSIACEAVLNSSNQTDEKPQTNQNSENHKTLEDPTNGHVQQSTVSVQATDFMPLQEESVVMENQQHHHPQPVHVQQTMQTDFYSRRLNNLNSSLGLQCAENNTDAGHVADSDEKFLLSCASAMHRLTNRQNSLVRLKIQQILFDTEFGQQQNN